MAGASVPLLLVPPVAVRKAAESAVGLGQDEALRRPDVRFSLAPYRAAPHPPCRARQGAPATRFVKTQVTCPLLDVHTGKHHRRDALEASAVQQGRSEDRLHHLLQQLPKVNFARGA